MTHKKSYFKVKNSIHSETCIECTGCFKLKMLELGLLPESILELIEHENGLSILKATNPDEFGIFSLAVRSEEIKSIFTKNKKCFFTFENVN